MSSSKVKAVFAGSGATGKTSIISVFMYDNFKQHTLMTVTPEKEYREITSSNGTIVPLEVWDTAGQERYRSVNRIYYKNAKIAFVVYDISDKKTFEEAASYWIPETKNILGESAIGNKIDLFDKEGIVTEEEGKELADKNDVGFFQTSAQSKLGINELFVHAVDLYIEKFGVDAIPTENTGKKVREKQKDDCCGGNSKKNKKTKKKDDDDDNEHDLNVQ